MIINIRKADILICLLLDYTVKKVNKYLTKKEYIMISFDEVWGRGDENRQEARLTEPK